VAIEIVTPAAKPELLKLDTVKAQLGISGSGQDTTLTDLILAVTATVIRITGRNWVRQIYKETLPGKGTPNILLSVTPIISISAVKYKEALIGADEYRVIDKDAGIVQRDGGWITTTVPWNTPDSAESNFFKDDWEFTYEGGYITRPNSTNELKQDFPYDLERAITSIVKADYRSDANGIDNSVTRYRIGDTDVSWDRGKADSALAGYPNSVANVIRYYTRPY